MDAKERAERLARKLRAFTGYEVLFDEALESVETEIRIAEREAIKQARNDALEEAAKIIDVPFNMGDESIEAKLTKGYVKAIRALKEKE